MGNQTTNQLQVYLANLEILYQKYRNYHWNVQGPHFIELHKFFEEQYEQLNEQIDVIAERIRMLDDFPLSSYKDFIEKATLQEDVIQSDSVVILQTLILDTETMIEQSKDVISACEEAKDPANADIVTAILETFEKTRWMLKSLNEGNN